MTFATHEQFRHFVDEVRLGLSNVYQELHAVNLRLEDVSLFEKKAEFAASTAETAAIGVSELRGIIASENQKSHARAARSIKLWIAILGSVSVLGSAAFTASTGRANAKLRLECAEVTRQELDRRELQNEARDARLAQKAAEAAIRLRDSQMELWIKPSGKESWE